MVHLFAIVILMCASGNVVNEGPQPLGCQGCDDSVGVPDLPYDPGGADTPPVLALPGNHRSTELVSACTAADINTAVNQRRVDFGFSILVHESPSLDNFFLDLFEEENVVKEAQNLVLTNGLVQCCIGFNIVNLVRTQAGNPPAKGCVDSDCDSGFVLPQPTIDQINDRIHAIIGDDSISVQPADFPFFRNPRWEGGKGVQATGIKRFVLAAYGYSHLVADFVRGSEGAEARAATYGDIGVTVIAGPNSNARTWGHEFGHAQGLAHYDEKGVPAMLMTEGHDPHRDQTSVTCCDCNRMRANAGHENVYSRTVTNETCNFVVPAATDAGFPQRLEPDGGTPCNDNSQCSGKNKCGEGTCKGRR